VRIAPSLDYPLLLKEGTRTIGAQGWFEFRNAPAAGRGVPTREKIMKNNYTYNEIMVRFYDAVYDNMPHLKDTGFYINRLVNAGGPALEIGCGTGRIFCDALKQGADVYGIDMSSLMLGKLKEKIDAGNYHRLRELNALELDDENKYNLIIAPFRMFQHVMTIDEQLKVLANVRRALVPGGTFIFDVFVPDPKQINTEVIKVLHYEGEYAPGRILKRYHSTKPDLINQTQHITFGFEWDEDGEVKHAEFFTPMRYFYRYELEHLVARSGLKLEAMYGDMNESPLGVKNSDFVTVCRKI
jgi:SAM-dependent methyltransferase